MRLGERMGVLAIVIAFVGTVCQKLIVLLVA